MQNAKEIGPSDKSSIGYLHNHSNGHAEHSPNSSHLSVHSEEALIQRTQKQQTTQQVTTVTKVVREVKHLGTDVQPVDYVAMPMGVEADRQQVDYVTMPLGMYLRSRYMDYNQMDPHQQNPNQYHVHYQDYEHYPQVGAQQYANSGYNMDTFQMVEQAGTPPGSSDIRSSPSPLPLNVGGGVQPDTLVASEYLQGQYDELPDYRTTPSPGGAVDHCYPVEPSAILYGYIAAPQYGTNSTFDTRPQPGMSQGAYDEEEKLQKQMSNLRMHNYNLLQHSITSPSSNNLNSSQKIDDPSQMRWRDPNLTEVIEFLNNPNNVIKANAAAYLQHLCYMDDPNKQRTRTLGGIPPLVKLLGHENNEVFRNACGALRNLSYGRQNDENKRAIKNAGGIQGLIMLLQRTPESDIKELVTGVIWNLSSCEDLKRPIIDEGLIVIVSYIIIPHSGWDPNNPGEICWSTVFRNASGILKNVSSGGEYARGKFRECEALIDSLLHVIRSGIEKTHPGHKIVDNCASILRNLSYRCPELDEYYAKNPVPSTSSNNIAAPSRSSLPNAVGMSSSSKSDNLGCFGTIKKKKNENHQPQYQQDNNGDLVGRNGGASSRNSFPRNGSSKAKSSPTCSLA